tara:strand:- start:2072 stop:2674 length:603 start_codon:yes stop_codon:yes gene_type:complete
MISVLKTSASNTRSLINALEYLDLKFKLTSDISELKKSTHIILPGVGSYMNLINYINKNFDYKELVQTINDKDKYFLGICVGMQILSDFGFEIKKTNGLGLISGAVKKINTNLKLPHVGWNSVFFKKEDLLFKDISSKTEFYFTHSYEFLVKSPNDILAEVLYDKKITSIVKKNNIYGVQFHPEKSQEAGLKLLKNFSVL